MGASNYAQMGTALSGSLVGGIGGLIEAQNYKRPRLPPATGPELRLRQLAQDQLLGGGQQLLGATALYNQLAPILMSQLPGMHYVPGSGGAPGSTAGNAPSSGSDSPMASYQQALQNYQHQQGLAQQRTQLRAQLKGAKGKAAKQAIKQQLKPVKQQLKSLPDAAALERMQYLGGVQQNPAMFDVRMGGANPSDPSQGAPSSADTLGSIHDLMTSLNTGPDYLQDYQQSAGGGSPRYYGWEPGGTPNFQTQILDQYLKPLNPMGGGLGALATPGGVY
jgi:hypothetical protein